MTSRSTTGYNGDPDSVESGLVSAGGDRRRSLRWKVGDRVGDRWDIHKIDDTGGMGTVYIVYDDKLHEPLAMKTFKGDERTTGERFRREALLWVKAGFHPNVVEARSVETIEAKPYVLMEFVSGGSLRRWIDTPRLKGDLQRVVALAIQFCDGMTYLVSQGVRVHRDIKPENCLITEKQELKVSDFGLAKAFDDDHSQPHGGITQTGMWGTPHYMAPEQFYDPKHADLRADIYSFGVMLFEMVAGNRPFPERHWEFTPRHTTKRVPHIPTLPPELDAVIQTCLAEDPDARFADFAVLRENLARTYRDLTGKLPPKPSTGRELNISQLLNRGTSLAELGQYREALNCFNRALELNPRDTDSWTSIGELLCQLGKEDEGLPYLDHALNLDPLKTAAWFKKGMLLKKRKDPRWRACIERAMDINPREADWLLFAWWERLSPQEKQRVAKVPPLEFPYSDETARDRQEWRRKLGDVNDTAAGKTRESVKWTPTRKQFDYGRTLRRDARSRFSLGKLALVGIIGLCGGLIMKYAPDISKEIRDLIERTQVKQTQKTDAQLAAAIKAQIVARPQMKRLHLRIEVRNRIVTLSGNVQNDAERYEARRIAAETADVSQVIDNIFVRTSVARRGTGAHH